MTAQADAERALADMVLAGRMGVDPILTFGTVVTDNADGTVDVHPDGAAVDTVVRATVVG